MQAFFHESETGCFRTDSDGRLLEVNRALVSMLGHETAEEMLRERGADEIFADRESGARLRRQYDATGVIVGAESRLVDRKGGTRHVILNARVMPMDGGEWFRHEYSAVDVSHRKHQAAVLDEQLQRFRRFADSSPYILFIVDPALDRVLYVNEAYERIFGRSTEGLYADRRDWLNAVHPQDLERVTKSLAGMSNHWQFDETFRIARGDGGVRWIHDRIFPIHSQDGQKVWLAGLAEDVTERRLAERERKRFIALSLDLICTLSFDGAIRRLNPAWQKVLGFSLGEIYVLSLEELIHPEDLDATLAKIQELAGGVATTHFENRMRCADGGWKSIAWAAVPDMEQKLIHAVGRDMTEQRRVEAMGRQQERDLAHLNRLRTVANLAYGLAHELNQPLFAIANFAAASAEALAADTSASAARMLEWNRRIGEQAVRAGEIVRRLATFSSKPNGARQPADVNALVAEAIRLVSLDAHWHGVRLNFAPGGDLPSVMADEILIEQVLVNLLRNAFESMVDTRDELRELVIRVRSCDEGVGVSVRDHGHGASPEQMAAAFDASFTSKRDGHGMGLSISKRIIESHGGRIWAEHHAGDGLTMHFTLATEAKVQP